MSQTDCDVLIVGAGISGAMIAYKAASAGLRVIVLEAGVPFERRQPWIDGYYQNGWPFMSDDCAPQQSDPGADWKDPKANYWEQVGNAQGIYGFDSNYERRGGGTTLHWLGTCMRFVPNDFTLKSTYQVAGAVDWPLTYKDIEPWYCAAESEIGVSGYNQNQYSFEGARSKNYPMSPLPQSYLDQQFMSALTGKSVSASGTEVPLFVGITPQGRNSNPYDARPACMGNSSCVPICPIQAKYDATVHIKKALAAKAPAQIRYRTVVTGLTVDPTTANITGVQYKNWEGDGGAEHGTGGGTLTARTYVIAAHAIETVKILLMSPWRVENGKSVCIANSSDQVGRNLMDHICQVSWALTPAPVYPFRGPLATSGIENFRDGALRSQRSAYRIEIGNDGWSWPTGAPQSTAAMFVAQGLTGSALRAAVADHASRQIRMAFEMESLPLSSSRVTLSDLKDKLGVPRPKIAYDLSPYTLDGFAESVDVAAQMFALLGVKPGDNYTSVDKTAPGYFSYKGKDYQYRGAGHVIGTYCMGSDAKSSVVDANSRSHDHGNLYLTGSGTFPTTGTANPTLTVAALSLRTADVIVAALTTKKAAA